MLFLLPHFCLINECFIYGVLLLRVSFERGPQALAGGGSYAAKELTVSRGYVHVVHNLEHVETAVLCWVSGGRGLGGRRKITPSFKLFRKHLN